MKDGGRLAAAIEVLESVEASRRPVQDLLKDWGIAHRFAGARDRTAIGNLVFDVLRRRRTLAAMMADERPRALVLAAYVAIWGRTVDGLEQVLADDSHAPSPLSASERAALAAGSLPGDLADLAAADLPEWLGPSLRRAFGPRLVAEGRALATRADIDLRVNRLQSNHDEVLAALAGFGVEPAHWSPVGIRVPAGFADERMPHLPSELSYKKGWFEIQDEGSQIAALVAEAVPGEEVLDLCAGGGGKSLALADAMQNRGTIYAFDNDKRRFGDILDRLGRNGVRNVELREPGRGDSLADLKGRMDLVLVDAPCTGTGTWRRRPDAKWRLAPGGLDLRLKEQLEVIERAATMVRPGGRLVYITCSLLPEENEDQLAGFARRHGDFRFDDTAAAFSRVTGKVAPELSVVGLAGGNALRLSPASSGTDGFFMARLIRA